MIVKRPRLASVVLLATLMVCSPQEDHAQQNSDTGTTTAPPGPHVTDAPFKDSPQEDLPLLLSPYLDRGEIDTARSLSSVRMPEFALSYSGFLTVDRVLGNHLFFWFFSSPQDPRAPLLIWLNGGPGISSMLGLFTGNGPLKLVVGSDGETVGYEKRKVSWAGPFSMLYIDNPVSAGFSFSDSGTAGSRLTQEGYSEDLYQFLLQFYTMFPEYLTRDLYIGGQSYAGRYVPALSYRIHTENQNVETTTGTHTHIKIPLKGIYIGGPFFDPETMMPAFYDHLYVVGVISHHELLVYKKDLGELYQRYVEKRLGNETLSTMLKVIIPPGTYMGPTDNFVTGERSSHRHMNKLMNRPEMRRLIHAGTKHDFSSFNQTFFYMVGEDIFVSTKPKLARLMNEYKVLIFNGDYDLTVSTTMMEAAMLSIPWSLQAAYNSSSRTAWVKDDEVSAGKRSSSQSQSENGRLKNTSEQAQHEEQPGRWSAGSVCGFYSHVGGLCRVVVHGAGHQTAQDQPEVTLEMMKKFIFNGCIGTQS
ncbi:probable serine carboxypeptidase CPVL [Aplysia californica]|uniref:Probable serine carboxypeptidase CPVL n=1 Tax=Aplysia californica TaxID=6500 RepID=A0ABM0JZK6_APLCA|nr:probable serine carboxypeptidase CPVL [Aplysia californica]